MKTKQCRNCGKTKRVNQFPLRRAQCKDCLLELGRAMYKNGAGYQDTSYLESRRMKNPYSSQSVLLMTDELECECCGEKMGRRAMGMHLKGHNKL